MATVGDGPLDRGMSSVTVGPVDVSGTSFLRDPRWFLFFIFQQNYPTRIGIKFLFINGMFGWTCKQNGVCKVIINDSVVVANVRI